MNDIGLLDRKQLVTTIAMLSGIELPEGIAFRILLDQHEEGWHVRLRLFPKPSNGEQGHDGLTYQVTEIPDAHMLDAIEQAAEEMLESAWDDADASVRLSLGGNVAGLDTSRMGKDG